MKEITWPYSTLRIQQYSVDLLDEDGHIFYSRLHNKSGNVTFAIPYGTDIVRCKARSAAGWSTVNQQGIYPLLVIWFNNWTAIPAVTRRSDQEKSSSSRLKRVERSNDKQSVRHLKSDACKLHLSSTVIIIIILVMTLLFLICFALW